MQITRSRKLFLSAVLLANLALWAIPSDVVELAARDHQVWLGRYSGKHLAWSVAVLAGSAIGTCVGFPATNTVRKKRAFRVLVILMVIVPAVVAVDLYLRATTKWPYVLGKLAYHRPPNSTFEGVFVDAPKAFHSYTDAPPGFESVPWKFTTDKRGFRNLTSDDHYDVVALGDSFTEGSGVSDDQPWPVRFAEKSGLSVCNLGMHGYAPQHYLAAVQDHGLALGPRWVMCMIYEGNDFRSARVTAEPVSEWSVYLKPKYSPVARAIEEKCFKILGHIGARTNVEGMEALSWLPVAVPPGPDRKYYTFPPSFLVNHYVARTDFQRGSRWKRTKQNLEAIHRLCKNAGAMLVIIYAPTKPRVVLPLVKDLLPAARVRAFTALRVKRKLPEPTVFLQDLFDRFDGKETTVTRWCHENSVPLISLTGLLRSSVRGGQQVYYTYDDHWTPVGHVIVGDAVYQSWISRLR